MVIGEAGPGTSKEVATEKKQLGVAPRQSSRFGLVCAPARREVENSGYRQSWGEVVLEQDSWSRVVKRWCLHKNEQGKALVK